MFKETHPTLPSLLSLGYTLHFQVLKFLLKVRLDRQEQAGVIASFPPTTTKGSRSALACIFNLYRRRRHCTGVKELFWKAALLNLELKGLYKSWEAPNWSWLFYLQPSRNKNPKGTKQELHCVKGHVVPNLLWRQILSEKAVRAASHLTEY